MERLIRAYLAGRQNGEHSQDFFRGHRDEKLMAIATDEALASPVETTPVSA